MTATIEDFSDTGGEEQLRRRKRQQPALLSSQTNPPPPQEHSPHTSHDSGALSSSAVNDQISLYREQHRQRQQQQQVAAVQQEYQRHTPWCNLMLSVIVMLGSFWWAYLLLLDTFFFDTPLGPHQTIEAGASWREDRYTAFRKNATVIHKIQRAAWVQDFIPSSTTQPWLKVALSIWDQQIEINATSAIAIQVKTSVSIADSYIHYGTDSYAYGTLGTAWRQEDVVQWKRTARYDHEAGSTSYARWQIPLVSYQQQDRQREDTELENIKSQLQRSWMRQKIAQALNGANNTMLASHTWKQMKLSASKSFITAYGTHDHDFYLHSLRDDGPWEERLAFRKQKEVWILVVYLGSGGSKQDDLQDDQFYPSISFGCLPGRYDYDTAKANDRLVHHRMKRIRGLCESKVWKPNQAVIFSLTKNCTTKPTHELALFPPPTTTEQGNVYHFFLQAVYVQGGVPPGTLTI